MPSLRSLLTLTLVASSLVALGGCIVENDPPSRGVVVIDPNNGPAAPQLLTPSASPGYAKIVTGASISQNPGQGAGVFVEYHGNGDWTLWTTCDSALGNGACNYEIDVEPTAGATLVSSALLADTSGDDSVNVSPSLVTARLRTLGEVDGITLHVDPPSAGVIVTGYIDGSADPKFLYWVGPDLDGPHMGAPTDPMQFDPTSPAP